MNIKQSCRCSQNLRLPWNTAFACWHCLQKRPKEHNDWYSPLPLDGPGCRISSLSHGIGSMVLQLNPHCVTPWIGAYRLPNLYKNNFASRKSTIWNSPGIRYRTNSCDKLIQAKWRVYTSVNKTIIGWENDLVPNTHRTIFSANADFLPIRPLKA